MLQSERDAERFYEAQRKTVDNKAVYAEANVPAELIEKHTKTTAVITLKVTAR